MVDYYNDGVDVVLLQGPTGTGKSLVGELVRRMWKPRDQGNYRYAAYTCTTKTLQDQLQESFEYAKVLKGRANYLTEKGRLDIHGQPKQFGYSDITCADCTHTAESSCGWCSERGVCPYQVAKGDAIQAELAILNTAYLITDLNLSMGSSFMDRSLYILDECDLLEGELLNQVEVEISGRRMETIGLDYPAKKTVEESWLPWVEYAIPVVKGYYRDLPGGSGASVKERREKEGIRNLLGKLSVLREELPNGGWVYDGYDMGSVIFRPVQVDRWGEQYLWGHGGGNGGKFLLMSATIISAEEMMQTLGYEGRWELIDAPMTYDVRNRPIRVLSLADMRNSSGEEEWEKCLHAVRGCCRLHPIERVLVHTVSYKLAAYLKRGLDTLDREVVTYQAPYERAKALGKYKATPGAILLAPSMDRGIDLPGDLCRVQIIAKVPYPNLGDKRINARLRNTKTGQSWYDVNTIRNIVQMTGRGVRGPDDKAETYIVDSQFAAGIYRKQKELFPEWWRKSLDMRYPNIRVKRMGEWE